MPDYLTISPESLPPPEAYRLLISCVVPRPIGWISTLSPTGVPNLAPYSFFNAVAGSPPVVMFSAGRRLGPKDTLLNAEQTGEFVVNIVSEDLLQAMNQTSGAYPYEVNEFEAAGLEPAPSVHVKPPRVAAARAALECRVLHVLPIEPTNYTAVFGQVLCFHIQSDLIGPDGMVDARGLAPVARLGGSRYATLGEVLDLPRPQV